MKRFLLLAAALTSLAVACVFPAGTAAAAAGCDTQIVDQTGKLSDPALVQTAVDKLTSAGATVRVRLIPSMKPYDKLEDWEKATEKRCSSWQDTNGERRDNLVVVIVSMDRNTDVEYGGMWSGALDSDYEKIQTDVMNPQFRMGKFDVGIAKGLDAVRQDIYGYEHPKPQPAPTIVEAPHKPANLTPLWVILSALAGIGLLIASGFGVRVRRNRKLTAEAKAKAIETRNSVADRVSKLNESHDALEQAAEIAKLTVADDDLKALNTALTAALAQVGAVSEAYGALHGPAADPQADHDRQGYEQITSRLTSLMPTIATAESAVADAQKLVDQFVSISKELPSRIATLKDAIAKGAQIRETATKAGFKVDTFDEQVAQVNASLTDAQAKLNAKELRAAADLVSKAETDYAAAKQWCQGLPQIKAGLDAAAEKLEQRLEQVNGACSNAKQVFETISAEYAESSWTAVAGNGSTSENLIAAAEAALASSRHSAGMDCQEWDAAQKTLDQASTGLDQADKLLAAILSLQAALAKAKAGAIIRAIISASAVGV